MPAGQKTPEQRLAEFVKSLEKVSSTDLLDLLATHLLTLEGSFGGRTPWNTRENVLQRCRLMVVELRHRSKQDLLF